MQIEEIWRQGERLEKQNIDFNGYVKRLEDTLKEMSDLTKRYDDLLSMSLSNTQKQFSESHSNLYNLVKGIADDIIKYAETQTKNSKELQDRLNSYRNGVLNGEINDTIPFRK